jgi:tetratricopeptide (TPR) repeat protein
MLVVGLKLTPNQLEVHKLYHPLILCNFGYRREDGQVDGERELQKAYESILGSDFEKAIEWFEKAIALEPDEADYHYKLSITYARSNKLEKALNRAKQAVRLQPDNESYRFHLQYLYAREKVQQAEKLLNPLNERLDMAIALLKEAIILDPLVIEAYLILGAAYAARQDYHLALNAVNEVLRLDPLHEIASQQITEYKHQLMLQDNIQANFNDQK